MIAAAQVPSIADLSGLTPDQLQQLQQLKGQASSGPQTSAPTVSTTQTVLEPTATTATVSSSDLERILSERAGSNIEQFGYRQLGVGRSVTVQQVGGMQEDYVLGLGDEIVLTLRGQENSEYRAQVDRDGNVTFPKLAPISGAGRSFGQFRQHLLAVVQKSYTSTQGFVTIGRLRQLNVLVSGEVNSPGIRTMTGLSTVVDAISVSGGIKKTGSLRNVQVVRGGRILSVDLYSLLISNVKSKDFALADGDKIIVPQIGATVAVAGDVRRPRIYELPAGRKVVGARAAVEMAGGTMFPGNYNISILHYMPDGKRQLIDVSNGSDTLLHDSEIIIVKAAVDISLNRVTLTGAVRAPRTVSLTKYKTLHDLLPSMDEFQPGAYLLLGIIDRTDPVTLQRGAVLFSPLRVVQGRLNFALQSDDTVRVLTKDGMRALLNVVINNNQQHEASKDERLRSHDQSLPGAVNGTNPAAGGLAVQNTAVQNTAVQNAAGQKETADLAAAAVAAGLLPNAAAKSPSASPVDSQGVAVAVPSVDAGGELGDLAAYASADGGIVGKTVGDHQVWIAGAVHAPGTYLVMPGTTLAELITAAGGLAGNVDLTQFELTSTTIDNVLGTSTTQRNIYPVTKEILATTELKLFDRLTFREVFSDRNNGSISISGEVRYPGSFDILRNEKLSSVLRRAGGYTDVAFPEGAIFQRNSVAADQNAANARAVADMRSLLLAQVMKPTPSSGTPMPPETMVAIQSLITQVAASPSLGRVPVVADIALLEKHPELDVLMEPGDSITIPRRPATVLVMGEVQRPGAQRFNSSNSPDSYIDLAGGTTEMADTSRVIVVRPDGSVSVDNDSWLNLGFGSAIPVGSTVYVPRKLYISSFREILTDTIQIVSQLATTAAALAVLSKQ